MPYELSDFHYLLLHFPIALFTSAFIFDLLRYFANNKLPDIGFYNLSFGVAFSIPTIIFGFITDNDIGHMDNIWPIHLTHGAVQIVVAILFLSLWFIRYKKSEFYKQHHRMILIINFFILLLLVYGSNLGAYLAGRLS